MKLPYYFGRYVLIQKIAKGGMAEIFSAKYIGENGFEKTVAIKKLLPEWSSNKNFTTMLIDEAKALVHLQHPNIVQIIELGKEQETYFLSMELVRGLDLGRFFTKVLRAQIELSQKFTLFIIAQILNALDFAHKQNSADGKVLNIVHRDISPQNVLLSWNGEVKVADFGIAKGTHRTYVTTVAQAKGKYSYMSPEQACGKTVDQRTDIYATGILLYELITKQLLYNAPSDLEVIELVKKSNPPSDKLQNIDNELKKIILKALSKDIQNRYQSSKEFLKDITNYITLNNLKTSGLEFSDFLKKYFSNEIVKEKVKTTNAENIYKKTLPLIEEAISKKSKHFKKTLQISLAVIPILAFFFLLQWQPITKQKTNTLEKNNKKQTIVSDLPAISKTSTISVHATPWAYVTIPGYIDNKETPINALRISAGEHTVKAYYKPGGKWLTKLIKVKNNQNINCTALFGKKSSLICK